MVLVWAVLDPVSVALILAVLGSVVLVWDVLELVSVVLLCAVLDPVPVVLIWDVLDPTVLVWDVLDPVVLVWDVLDSVMPVWDELDPVSIADVLVVDSEADDEVGALDTRTVECCEVSDVVVGVVDVGELAESEADVSVVGVVVPGELGGDASVVDSEVVVWEVLVRLEVVSVSEVCEVLSVVVDCSVVDGTEDMVLFVTI